VISAFVFFFFFVLYVVMLAIFKCEFLEAAKAKTLSFKQEKKKTELFFGEQFGCCFDVC
jgi:hypothetical protein